METRPVGSPPVSWTEFSEAFLARFITWSVRDLLCDRFPRLEQGSMTISEYEVRFHELFRHAMMISPTEQERIHCFVRGLRFQLRFKAVLMVSMGRSFLDVVDYTHAIEQLYREVEGSSDKRARHQGSYSGYKSRHRDSYDRPHQRFQQGQSSRPIQAALHASEGDQYRQSGSSVGQSLRGSDIGSTGRGGRYFVGHSSQGCYNCGELDHWSRDCPRRGMIAPAPHATRPVSAAPPLARGVGQGQDRWGGHQGARGGLRGGRSRGQSEAQDRGGQGHLYATPARAVAEASDAVITGSSIVTDAEFKPVAE